MEKELNARKSILSKRGINESKCLNLTFSLKIDDRGKPIKVPPAYVFYRKTMKHKVGNKFHFNQLLIYIYFNVFLEFKFT